MVNKKFCLVSNHCSKKLKKFQLCVRVQLEWSRENANQWRKRIVKCRNSTTATVSRHWKFIIKTMTFTFFTRFHFYRKSWIVNLLLSHGGNETTNSSTIDQIEEELERIATLQYLYVSICVPSWAQCGFMNPYWRGNRTNRDPALFLCKCIHSTTRAQCGFTSPYWQGNRANGHPVVSICMQAFLPGHSVGPGQNKSLPCICKFSNTWSFSLSGYLTYTNHH